MLQRGGVDLGVPDGRWGGGGPGGCAGADTLSARRRTEVCDISRRRMEYLCRRMAKRDWHDPPTPRSRQPCGVQRSDRRRGDFLRPPSSTGSHLSPGEHPSIGPWVEREDARLTGCEGNVTYQKKEEEKRRRGVFEGRQEGRGLRTTMVKRRRRKQEGSCKSTYSAAPVLVSPKAQINRLLQRFQVVSNPRPSECFRGIQGLQAGRVLLLSKVAGRVFAGVSREPGMRILRFWNVETRIVVSCRACQEATAIFHSGSGSNPSYYGTVVEMPSRLSLYGGSARSPLSGDPMLVNAAARFQVAWKGHGKQKLQCRRWLSRLCATPGGLGAAGHLVRGVGVEARARVGAGGQMGSLASLECARPGPRAGAP